MTKARRTARRADAGRPGAPVIVARVARPHGIRGALLLEAETDHAEALFRPGRQLRLVSTPATAGTPAAAGAGALTIASVRPHAGRWLAEMREVADRNAAETLRGARLCVPREELPELPDGGYLLHDLVGMSVCEAGETIGVVRDVYDQPGAPLLALDVSGQERLVPFQADLVEDLDFRLGVVHMTLPAGLLEI